MWDAALHHPRKTVLSVLALGIAALVYTLLSLGVEFSADALTLEGDEDLRFYQETRAEFHSDEFVLCAITSANHFTKDGVALLGAFTRDLRDVQGVDQVLSVANIPLFRSSRKPWTPAQIMSMRLPFVQLTDEDVDLERARTELTQHAAYGENIISRDGRVAGCLVFLKQDPRLVELTKRRALLQREARVQHDGRPVPDEHALERHEIEERYAALQAERAQERALVIARIRNVLDHYRDAGHEVYAAGVPAIVEDLLAAIRSDVLNFAWLSLGFLTLFLAFVFRSVTWLVASLATAALTVLFTLAVFCLAGHRLTIVSANMPSLLAVLGLAHSIHIFVRCREIENDPALTLSGLARLKHALRELVRPCLGTTATTMVGFIGLAVAGVRPVIEFGGHMALGIAFAFLLSFTFLPALVLGWENARHETLPKRHAPLGRPSRWLAKLSAFSVRRRVFLVTGAALTMLACVFGILRLSPEARFLDYLDPRAPSYESLAYLDRHLGGTMPLEVVLDAKEDAYFTSLAGLQRVATVEHILEAEPAVGSVSSIDDFATEVERAWPIAAKPPRDDCARIALGLLGVEKSSMYVTQDGRRARILARIHESDPELERADLLHRLQRTLDQQADTIRPVAVRPTGMFLLYTNVLDSLVGSLVETSFLALGLIFTMLLMVLLSVRAALLGLIPNVLPLFVVLGVMGACHVPLNLATVMIASVALGLAIDASIHYLYRFREERRRHRDHLRAIFGAHGTIGVSILYTSVTAVAAFWVLLFSRFRPNANFGILTGLAMAASLFATLTLLPGLIAWLKPFGHTVHPQGRIFPWGKGP